MRPQTISRAARSAGVHVETIRYYERVGLIERPRTMGTKYRTYPQDTVRRIRFIKRAQALGFKLREIRELLELRADPAAPRAAVRRRVESKLNDIESRIKDLQAMRRSLRSLHRACTCRNSPTPCPILESLESTPTTAPLRRKR